MFGLSSSYQSPVLDPGDASPSSPFSIANSTWAMPSLNLSGSLSTTPSSEPPLWKQILSGLSELDSLLDRYIYTDQEKAQYDIAKLLAEADKAKAFAEAEKAKATLASIQVQPQPQPAQPQPAVPTWAWVVGGAVLVLILFLLLRE